MTTHTLTVRRLVALTAAASAAVLLASGTMARKPFTASPQALSGTATLTFIQSLSWPCFSKASFPGE